MGRLKMFWLKGKKPYGGIPAPPPLIWVNGRINRRETLYDVFNFFKS